MVSREKQYADLFEFAASSSPVHLGVSAGLTWKEDPKRLVFVLSRYKFISKMLKGKKSVAEIGCGDGFASRIVAQQVEKLLATDFDPLFISAAKNSLPAYEKRITFIEHNIIEDLIPTAPFDAIYSCDVLEHISIEDESDFFRNSIRSLKSSGILIIGTPSLASQTFASPRSKVGHINCKSGDQLWSLCDKYFENVFLFGMNDEVLHTGFTEMSHYYFALCLGPRILQ